MGKGLENDGDSNKKQEPSDDSTQKLRDDAAGRPVTQVEAPAAPERPSSAESKAATNPTQGADRGLSQTEKSALSKLDGQNLMEKMNLSPEQSDMLRNLEGAILKGDSSAVQNLLRQHHGNPDALKPMMDVLIKDLAKGGIRANYDVDFALTDDDKGGAERTGIFDMRTSKTPEDWLSKESTSACFYTNPKSTGFANHMTPAKDRSPYSNDIPLDLGLKDIGVKIATSLLETKRN